MMIADAATVSLPCRELGPELYFSDNPAEIEQAKSACMECPVRARCLQYALERAEPHGVWGGQLFSEGVVIARKRPRGRPRKHPLPEPLVAREASQAAA